MAKSEDSWIAKWLDAVTVVAATMSQRRRSSIDSNGRIEEVIDTAKKRCIHLTELTDDKGDQLAAASVHPFRLLC